MNTTEILSKLSEMGLPENIISFISEKIASGVDIASMIQNSGVEGMLSSLGIDVSGLTNIDFSSFPAADFFGVDTDGDGLTGMDEISDTISDSLGDAGGIFDKIKSFF